MADADTLSESGGRSDSGSRGTPGCRAEREPVAVSISDGFTGCPIANACHNPPSRRGIETACGRACGSAGSAVECESRRPSDFRKQVRKLAGVRPTGAERLIPRHSGSPGSPDQAMPA